MNGYIGFFDILGYKNFLKNTPNDDAQKAVLQQIVNIKKSVTESLKTSCNGNLPQGIDALINQTQWIIFSDTIVFTIESVKSPEDNHFRCIVAFTTTKHLMTQMFNYGLPLRGALHFGQYNVIESSMAGTGIIESIESGQHLNASVCVLTQKLVDQWLSFNDEKDSVFLDEVSIEYKILNRENKREKQKCLMWFGKDDEDKKMQSDEIKNILKEDKYGLYVRNAFWKHNKTVSDSKTKRKLKETERFIRYCVSKQK